MPLNSTVYLAKVYVMHMNNQWVMLTQTAYFDDCIDHALNAFSFYPQKSGLKI